MGWNKKGTVLWWAIFLIIVAAGVFLVRVNQGAGLEVKGEWQTDFIKNNYLEAEKELLRIDSTTQNIGIDVARTMTKNGGFIENGLCGKHLNTNLLISNGEWCLPNIEENFATLAKSKLNNKLSNYQYTDISYEGKIFHAKGERKSISSAQGIYYFNTGFAINLGYSFDEFYQIFDEAKSIFSLCSASSDLAVCLNKNKKDYWNYGSCGSLVDVIASGAKKVSFCVQSPNLYSLPWGNSFFRTNTPVNYQFALDFTPSEGAIS
jgi:hypothetical protein